MSKEVTFTGKHLPLGFEGEFWHENPLPKGTAGTVIPIPGSMTNILVVFDYIKPGYWSIVYKEYMEHTDDALMAACLVRRKIDEVSSQTVASTGETQG